MNLSELSNRVSKLIAENNFNKAEDLLLGVRREEEAAQNIPNVLFIISELIELYCIYNPPRWPEAEILSAEREQLSQNAYSILQTALILFHGRVDFLRAMPKLEKAIIQSRSEQDDKTRYTALGLLGQTYLQSGNNEKAFAILDEMEEMVGNKPNIVIGDETCFLEAIAARGLEIARIKKLAATLVIFCRDTAFQKRLEALENLGIDG